MTFEEFFKRKKIDLAALEQGEGGLFTEFKSHYEQMGEKSFDHTKKYWFNQLRRRFPAAPEIKVDKVKIENALAEQTIAGELTSPAKDTSVGFKPRFKAANTTAPIQSEPTKQIISEPDTSIESKDAETPKVGFKPRFKAAMVAKPAEPTSEKVEETALPDATEESVVPASTDTPKVGFKPRFKAAMVAKPVAETPNEHFETPPPAVNEEPTIESQTENTEAKQGGQ